MRSMILWLAMSLLTLAAAACECREPSVDPEDPLYERFEGVSAMNACESDADCVVSGCSSEVCAAESLVTTCEELPYLPTGDCGCVDGQCQWYEDACQEEVETLQEAPQTEGDGISSPTRYAWRPWPPAL